MGLLDRVKSDIERITSDLSGFAKNIVMIPPGGAAVTFNGLHTKISMGYDLDGNIVNSRKAHISISEKYFIENNYPLRNVKGEVELSGHKVNVTDSTGVVKNYYIQSSYFPDETIGLITCILFEREDG
jgi:hypothetical protein